MNQNIKMKTALFYFFSFAFMMQVVAQEDPSSVDDFVAKLNQAEENYYKIINIPVPENLLLEIGGVATLPDGRVAVSTRRGDVWLIENSESYIMNGKPHFKLFASGLHEALGCAYKDNALYVAQRGELTKLIDNDGDDVADVYQTIYKWPLTGHYHEYSYGPALAPDGTFFVTGNVSFVDPEWWRGVSAVPMRGWTMKITEDGQMEPWATGQRSPCGLGIIDGELFYTDNQGDWVGSGGVWHVKKGAFLGHPAGLVWTDKIENSPVKLTQDELYAVIDKRQKKNDQGDFIKPENETNETVVLFADLKEKFPEVQSPAVWLPHGIFGISNSQILQDNTGGKFGPFAGQILVGDQGQSKIMRVDMEVINGEYQGVVFDFKQGFQSGVLRMDWLNDGSLFVGMTNRGWGSAGNRDEGIQRLIWTGKMPFEMKTVKAMPDGFQIEFTKPIDPQTFLKTASIEAQSFAYKYHPVYGSPPVNNEPLKIQGMKISEDGKTVRLVINNLRKNYIHELRLNDVKSVDGDALLHQVGYYTLKNIPEGEKLSATDLVKFRSGMKTAAKSTTKTETKPKATTVASNTKKQPEPVDVKAVNKLLQKYTCFACHNADKKLVGPPYKEIAKRGYSDAKIVELIYKPNPKNWPDYATEMAPMPQVPKADALKIAAYINSLK